MDIIYFYITTDTGRSRDGYEITLGSIVEYLEGGAKMDGGSGGKGKSEFLSD